MENKEIIELINLILECIDSINKVNKTVMEHNIDDTSSINAAIIMTNHSNYLLGRILEDTSCHINLEDTLRKAILARIGWIRGAIQLSQQRNRIMFSNTDKLGTKLFSLEELNKIEKYCIDETHKNDQTHKNNEC